MTPTTDFGETSTLPRTSAGKKRAKQSVCFLPILVQEKVRQSPQGSSCVNVSDAVAATSNDSSACVQQQPQRSFIRTCNRAKRVKFFRNGDQYFKGIWYAITYDRYRCLEALLEDLNRTIGDLVNLPHGVRCIFTIDGSRRVKNLDDLLDGESYVCSSNDSFKKIDYDKAKEPIWCYGTSARTDLLDNENKYDMVRRGFTTLNYSSNSSYDFVYPKIVTVIRNGIKPRRVVRLLLNKRTAKSFEQVLSDITALVKLDTGAVRKLFSLDGNLVTCLFDLFKDDDIFIACGNERLSMDDFYLDSEEYKFLYSSKYRPPMKTIVKQTPLSARGDFSSSFKQKHRNNIDAAYGSPELRRKFLKQKSSKKTKHNDSSQVNDKGGESTNSCLSIDIPREIYPLEIEDRYKIGRILGDGNFAVVYECICRANKMNVALKVIEKSKCCGKFSMIENEVDIMRRLQHEHIVQLVDYHDLDAYFFLVVEYVKGGDLFDSLISVRYYSEFEAALLMQNLLSALEYLHDRSITHRDVKPENLLVFENDAGRKQLKLADFGLATYCDTQLYTICGTPTYVAPEILTESGYGPKIDVWASGVIMYIMLCGFPPFVSVSNNQEELFELILSGNYTFPKPYWNHVSATAKTLIQGMLEMNEQRRFTAAEALSHVWITGEGKYDPELEDVFRQVLSDQEGRNNPSAEYSDCACRDEKTTNNFFHLPFYVCTYLKEKAKWNTVGEEILGEVFRSPMKLHNVNLNHVLEQIKEIFY